MADKYDPYRESLVIETRTIWPEDVVSRKPDAASLPQCEAALHAHAAEAAVLDYVRLHAGFCRQITVTPADLDRLQPT